MKRMLTLLLALAITLVPAYAFAGVADKAATAEKVVALTLEDIETAVQLEDILRLCREKNIKVTFFISGNQLEKYPLREAAKQGHEIGNHGMIHNYWAEAGTEAIAADLEEAARLIQATTGIWPRFTRPPYNYYGDNFLNAAAGLSQATQIVRGMDTGDWLVASPQAVLESVVGSVRAGDIININMKTKAAAAVPAIIAELQQAGYRFVTLAELLGKGTAQEAAKPFEAKKEQPIAVVERIAANQPYIALTFDDCGSLWQADEILNILRAAEAKSTFFLNGDWAAANPEFIRRAVQEGHEIANHSYTHPPFTQLGEAEMRAEILAAQRAIITAIGQKPRLFRPPYGDYDSTVVDVLQELGYDALVMWDIDSRDWTGLSAEAMVHRVSARAAPGSIVLFHLHGANTPAALRELIPLLKAQGYILTTVTTLRTGTHG